MAQEGKRHWANGDPPDLLRIQLSCQGVVFDMSLVRFNQGAAHPLDQFSVTKPDVLLDDFGGNCPARVPLPELRLIDSAAKIVGFLFELTKPLAVGRRRDILITEESSHARVLCGRIRPARIVDDLEMDFVDLALNALPL